MSNSRRFWIGGGGALLPLLITLLGVDLSGIIDHASDYSVGIYVGAVIRYLAMFTAGGVVAALNSDEQSPIKIVQLGIAAPALIATYVNAQTPKPPPPDTTAPSHATSPTGALNFIAPAYGMDVEKLPKRLVVAGGFFTDVLKGATNSLPAIATVSPAAKAIDKRALERAIDDARKSATEAAAAAHNAAVAADKAASQPTAEATAASKKSATDASLAAQKANSDIKALQDAAKAVK
jgi:hypothetical protein